MFNDYVKSESKWFSLCENVAITHFHNFVCSGVNGVGLHGTQSPSCILECQCFNSFILWCATFTKTANKMQHTIGRSLLHFVSHETLFDINLFGTKLQHIEYKEHVRANRICTLVEYYFVLLVPLPPVKRTNCANWSNVYIVSNIADYIPNAFRFNSRNFQNE